MNKNVTQGLILSATVPSSGVGRQARKDRHRGFAGLYSAVEQVRAELTTEFWLLEANFRQLVTRSS